MKYKTFISTLILFQIFFYAGFLFVSMYMTNSLFTAARERALGDHSLIAFSFAKDLAAVSDRSGSVESSIRPLFDFYTAHYSRQNVFIEITKHTKSLYSTLPNGLANNGGAPSPNSAANVVYINKSGDGTLIFVNGGIPGADDYFLNYAFDISKDIDSLRQTERTMLLVGTLFSVLAAVFLYFIPKVG